MIQLIVGKKGSGKTKTLIDLVNAAAEKSKGNVICIEKGRKLTFDLKSAVRLIDTEEYHICGFEVFYAFLAGLLAGNYDITEIFIDSILKIGGSDMQACAAMITKLNETFQDTSFVFTVSADNTELPQSLHEFIVK